MVLFLSILGLIVIFKHVLHLVLVSFLLVLNVHHVLEWFREEPCACEHVLNTFQKCFAIAISLLFKGCVRYIFATLRKKAPVKLGKMFFISLKRLFSF